MMNDAWSQGSVAPDRVVVSYPSKSITSFPILETAQRLGFFRRENLDVSAVYMRGGIDINPFRSNFEDPLPNIRLWRQ